MAGSRKSSITIEVSDFDLENSITVSAATPKSGYHLFLPKSPKSSASSSSASPIASPRRRSSSPKATASLDPVSPRKLSLSAVVAGVLTPKRLTPTSSATLSAAAAGDEHSKSSAKSVLSRSSASSMSVSMVPIPTSIGSGMAGSPVKTDLDDHPVYIEEATASAALEVFKSRKISLSEQLELRTEVIKLQEMDNIRDKNLPTLQEGAYFMVLSSKGVKKRRFFKLSEDESRILYGKSPKRCSDSIEVSKICDLNFGPNPGRIEMFDWSRQDPTLFLSFNVSAASGESRFFSLEAESEEQASVWFLSLQALAPLGPRFVSKGKLLWKRAILKSQKIAVNEDKTIPEVWDRAMDSAALKMLLLKKL